MSALQAFKQTSAYTKKRLGQHFLTSERVLRETIEAAQITKDTEVLEIGAGCGVLTEKLLEQGARVTALEIDRDLIAFLDTYFAPQIATGQLRIIHADARKFQPDVQNNKFTVVGNIPYYTTSPLISHYIKLNPAPERIIFLVQREVAERVCATPGEMNILALETQLFTTPSIITRVPAGSFSPPPKVESALLKLEVKTESQKEHLTTQEIARFHGLISHAFSKKRKTLENALTPPLQKNKISALLHQLQIDSRARPQDLSLDQWISLTRACANDTLAA